MSGSKIKIPFPEFHPKVNSVAKSLYQSGHYTDALRKSSIKLEEECKAIYLEKTGDELSGVPLMQKLFSYNDKKTEGDANFCECHMPVVNLSTKKGVTKQKAYSQFFASFMEIIRNTLAHSSDDLDEPEALYGLNIVSYLFYKLDQSIYDDSSLNDGDKEKKKDDIVEGVVLNDKQIEDLVILILSDENIKSLSGIESENTSLILSIKERVEEIVAENVDNIGVDVYNVFFANLELRKNIYKMVLKKIKK